MVELVLWEVEDVMMEESSDLRFESVVLLEGFAG